MSEVVKIVVSNAPGPPGGPGGPGGNILAVGTRDELPGMLVPVGTKMIQTTGDTALGDGPWQWIRSADQASGGSAFRKQDSSGAWFDKLDRTIVPFGSPQGGTAAAVTYLMDPRQARFGVVATDTVPMNDSMGFFAGIVGQLGRQPTVNDNALYSLVSGRNSYVIGGGYGPVFGHDCLNLAVAGFAGGAGTVVGRYDNPAQGILDKDGYGSFAYGKNGQTRGQSAIGMGDEFRANSRSSVALGYQPYAERAAALGAVAMGAYATVDNGGQFSIGSLLTSNGAGRMALGSGVNPGSRFVNDIDNSLQLGSTVLRGTVVFMPGLPADSYTGKFYSRSGFRSMGDNGGTTNIEFGGFHHNLDNSASGATTTARITTRTAGTVTPVVDLRNDFLRPVTDNVVALGGPSNRFTTVYAASSTISTSDEDAKQEIGAIPDEWLDAWGEVEWCRFRFKEAVAEKGDAARWHVGLIAQRVRDAFAAHGIDALSIGLLCYDEWGESREPVLKKVKRTTTEDRWQDTAILGPDGTPAQKKVTVKHHHFEMVDTGRTRVVREGGSLWGLRYEECFAIEAAYQRRAIAQLREQLRDRGVQYG